MTKITNLSLDYVEANIVRVGSIVLTVEQKILAMKAESETGIVHPEVLACAYINAFDTAQKLVRAMPVDGYFAQKNPIEVINDAVIDEIERLPDDSKGIDPDIISEVIVKHYPVMKEFEFPSIELGSGAHNYFKYKGATLYPVDYEVTDAIVVKALRDNADIGFLKLEDEVFYAYPLVDTLPDNAARDLVKSYAPTC